MQPAGTHRHVAPGSGQRLGRQHVRLHQIAHVDPVHARAAVPESEQEQPLLDVALGRGRGGAVSGAALNSVFAAWLTDGSRPVPAVPAGTGDLRWRLLPVSWQRQPGPPPPARLSHLRQLTCRPAWPGLQSAQRRPLLTPRLPPLLSPASPQSHLLGPLLPPWPRAVLHPARASFGTLSRSTCVPRPEPSEGGPSHQAASLGPDHGPGTLATWTRLPSYSKPLAHPAAAPRPPLDLSRWPSCPLCREGSSCDPCALPSATPSGGRARARAPRGSAARGRCGAPHAATPDLAASTSPHRGSQLLPASSSEHPSPTRAGTVVCSVTDLPPDWGRRPVSPARSRPGCWEHLLSTSPVPG